jgi:cell division protein FtsN
MAHGDPQGGATADARSVSPDASKNAPVKNRDTAVAAKAEVKAPPVPAVATIPLPERSSSSTSDKGTNERIALQKNRASEIMPKAQAGVAAQSKALEGYIIQLGFKDKGDAQRWAEMMERRGYAVSVTEAGGMESVRVRVGNFLVREEADRQLISLKQEGLTGIVINLPQAYRPDMRAPSSERSETQFVQPQGAQELGGKR